MTDTVLLAIIAGAPAFVAALYTGRKISEIHLTINSKMDQLLKITGESEYARGVKESVDASSVQRRNPYDASSRTPSSKGSSTDPGPS